jgi:hypothetical protein
VFLGHFALGLAAKKKAPGVSLGTLFLSCQFADLLWPTLLLLGFERVEIEPGNTVITPLNFVSYPYSHSLVMLLVWSALFALVYRFTTGRNAAAPIVIAALVFSHYVLDVLTHRPDMPLTIGGTAKIGLGLWNHRAATLAIESAMFAAGTFVYSSVTRARDRIGSIGLWTLIAFLVVIYGAAIFGPPPPDTSAIAVAGHATWLLVIWAYWIDRHREAR